MTHPRRAPRLTHVAAALALGSLMALSAGCAWNSSPRLIIEGRSYGASTVNWTETRPSVAGSGVITADPRSGLDFHEVHLIGPFDVVIDAGGSGASLVTVHTDDNLQSLIGATVRNGRLEIEALGPFSTRVMPRIEIQTSGLQAVTVSGSGDLVVTGVAADSFSTQVNGSGEATVQGSAGSMKFAVSGSGEVEAEGIDASHVVAQVTGSGEMTLRGRTDTLVIKVSGSGEVYGADLHANRAEVSVTGSGDVEVRVLEALEASVSGSGDISYIGAPTISIAISGSGSITPAN